MALQSSGAISANDIRTEYGLTGSLSFGNLYRGGNVIRNNYGNTNGFPFSGSPLEFADFYTQYKEGTVAQKIANWELYRAYGLHTCTKEGGVEERVTHSGELYQNNPRAAPGSPQLTKNTETTTRASHTAVSEWTTCIGISASGGMSNNTTPFTSSHTHYGTYYDTHNGNANMALVQINKPFTELGNITYRWNRFNTWRWGEGFLILMPGKWEVNRDYTATGSGWGSNSLGITNNAPSISLAYNEIAIHGRERGGDGASSGGIAGTNISSVSRHGWWYNTGNVGIVWPTNGATSTSPYMFNEQPDGTWILREIS